MNGKYALVTMCIGGGQGIAAVFERAVSGHRRFAMIRPKQASDRASRSDAQDGRCFTARFCWRRLRLSGFGLVAAQAAMFALLQRRRRMIHQTHCRLLPHERKRRWVDVNLRHSSDYGKRMVPASSGHRRWMHSSGVAAGDRNFGATVRLQPSAQLASGGFVGGSLNIETGNTWVVGPV